MCLPCGLTAPPGGQLGSSRPPLQGSLSPSAPGKGRGPRCFALVFISQKSANRPGGNAGLHLGVIKACGEPWGPRGQDPCHRSPAGRRAPGGATSQGLRGAPFAWFWCPRLGTLLPPLSCTWFSRLREGEGGDAQGSWAGAWVVVGAARRQEQLQAQAELGSQPSPTWTAPPEQGRGWRGT